jgi:hypothetical protein
MMKWAKERDSLIAQTRAFVNSVIAWKADTAPPSGSVQPIAIENTFAARLREELEQIEGHEKPEHKEAPEDLVQALPVAELPSPRPAPSEPAMPEIAEPAVTDTPLEKEARQERAVQNDVRKEIQSRVAAFQAHQHRFAREREAYFNSVLTKARSAIDGKNSDGDHDTPAA